MYMSKFEHYVLVLLLSALVCSCTVALYYQNHTQDSSQVVTNPVELRSDSSVFHLEFPLP